MLAALPCNAIFGGCSQHQPDSALQGKAANEVLAALPCNAIFGGCGQHQPDSALQGKAANGFLTELTVMIAAHIVFGCYGFWLPNDPRGSWSTYVASYKLFYFAGADTKVATRYSVAHQSHDSDVRIAAKEHLKFSPVILSGLQARAAIRGFETVVKDTALTVFACAIMPDHVHLVVAPHERTFGRLVGQLKSVATKRMNTEQLGVGHTPWARGHWEVWLDTDDDVQRAIQYVEENPIKADLKPQHWSLVIPYR